jgi:uncharacterized membrane protein
MTNNITSFFSISIYKKNLNNLDSANDDTLEVNIL